MLLRFNDIKSLSVTTVYKALSKDLYMSYKAVHYKNYKENDINV